jgi:thymidylate synthase
MRTIAQSATREWLDMINNLLDNGLYAAPRGQNILELLAAQITIDMEYPVVSTAARKLGYKFMAAEAYWILTGDDRVETIAPYSKAIANFSDNGVTFDGAYGPMIQAQFDYIIETLVKDPDSRQAVMTIWRPSPAPSKDIPCTVSVQFLIRDGFLHVIDTMRSSDIWLGVPYDLFNFTMLAVQVGLALRDRGLRVQLGALTLQAGSQHLYVRNAEEANKVLVDDADAFPAPVPITLDMFGNREHHLKWLKDLRETGVNRFYEDQCNGSSSY